MSAEIVRVDVLPTISKKGTPSNLKDYSSNIKREENVFNEYVKPHEGAVWDSQATRIHGLTEHNPKIIGADGMDLVWPRFLQWFANHLKREEVAALVAYNGETCDLKWLWSSLKPHALSTPFLQKCNTSWIL